MISFENDTIAAISSGLSNSGIGIVRVSGDEAIEIVNRIFRSPSGKPLTDAASHTIHYGNIISGDKVLDEVLVMLMRAPHTFTREDTVEIDCHGGIYVTQQVLKTVLAAGARAAGPGEFTQRAFLNGRIDLAQAEAVIDIINAENDFALQSAEAQLKGSISEKIRGLRAVLLEQIAYIEAALDDPEHIEMEGYGTALLSVVDSVSARIRELSDTFDDGRVMKDGIRTVILGKPNVGKSSLLNALLGQERAIVTDIAGTTRDALEEKVRLGDLILNVTDTAGIRDTDDIIEKIGVEKAKEYIKDADLILFIADASRPLSEEDTDILELIRGKKRILLLNKQDLGVVTDESSFSEYFVPSSGETHIIRMSVKEHEGIDELTETIRDMFIRGQIKSNDQIYITNERHRQLLDMAEASLSRTRDCIEAGLSEDFYTIDMMDAYADLGLIIGEAVDDDLADEIFAKFCMGK